MMMMMMERKWSVSVL